RCLVLLRYDDDAARPDAPSRRPRLGQHDDRQRPGNTPRRSAGYLSACRPPRQREARRYSAPARSPRHPSRRLGPADDRRDRPPSGPRLRPAEIARPLSDFPRLPIDLSLPEALVPFDDGNELAAVEDEGHIIAVVTRASLLAAFADHLRKRTPG